MHHINSDISINAVFSATAAPVTDLSTTTIVTTGNDIYINVPAIKYTYGSGSITYYAAEFMYVLT